MDAQDRTDCPAEVRTEEVLRLLESHIPSLDDIHSLRIVPRLAPRFLIVALLAGALAASFVWLSLFFLANVDSLTLRGIFSGDDHVTTGLFFLGYGVAVALAATVVTEVETREHPGCGYQLLAFVIVSAGWAVLSFMVDQCKCSTLLTPMSNLMALIIVGGLLSGITYIILTLLFEWTTHEYLCFEVYAGGRFGSRRIATCRNEENARRVVHEIENVLALQR